MDKKFPISRYVQIGCAFIFIIISAQCKLELFNAGDTRSDAFRRTQLLRCLLGQCEIPFASLVWTEANRTPTANAMSEGSFVNDQVGFIVGSDGLILRTADGGLTWNRLVAGDRDHDLNSIAINPHSKVVFIGGGKIDSSSTFFQYSLNSGRQWTNISLGVNGIVSSIKFADSLNALLTLQDQTSDKTYIFSSSDGGFTWRKVSEQNFIVNQLTIFPSGTGYISGYNTTFTTPFLKKTQNFGETWQDVNMVSGSSLGEVSISFVSPNIGYVALVSGGQQTIRKTYNGGESFESLSLPSNLAITSVARVKFQTETQGYFIANTINTLTNNSIFKTIDGGNTWTASYIDARSATSVSGVIFEKNSIEVFAFMNTSLSPKLLYSGDSGSTWSARAKGDGLQFGRIVMPTETIGYTSGGFAAYPKSVYKTIDGGKTWNSVFETSTNLFRDTFATASGVVWAVGQQRTAVYSNDYGANWLVPASFGAINATTEFRGVSFNNSGVGLLAGYQGSVGAIARSTDFGNNWSNVFTINARFLNVRFINETKAIAVSGFTASNTSQYGVYLSNDAGATWTQVPSMSGILLYDIHVLNENTFYVASGASSNLLDLVYRTTDGGTTWTKIFEKTALVSFNTSVAFSDELNGIVSGRAGLWKTSDGGSTWSRELPVSDGTLLGIAFLPSKTRVIGSGSSGTIQYRSWP